MKVRDLIAELIKCDMDSTVIISVENCPDLDEAHSVVDMTNNVVISSEW